MSAAVAKAKAKEVIAANVKSAIVSAAWLDHRKKPVSQGPHTWVYQRIELANGAKFILGPEVLDALKAHGWTPRWKL